MRTLLLLIYISAFAGEVLGASGHFENLQGVFEEGRALAISYLNDVARYSAIPPKLLTPAQVFLQNYRLDLAADIAQSPHRWRHDHARSFVSCGVTMLGKLNAPVFLSSRRCGLVNHARYAAVVLIHEAVHHIDRDKNETEADAIAWSAVSFYPPPSRLRLDSRLFIAGLVSIPTAFRMVPESHILKAPLSVLFLAINAVFLPRL